MVEFKRVKLKNGLIILHEKRELAVTTVMLASRFGSAYESEKEKGIAHFLEHMCFKGTKKRNAKQISSDVEKLGGILNAYTGEEVTNFHVKLPSEHLGKAMEVLFDMYFNSVFSEDEIKKEAKVVCEEIKMYKDHPRMFVLTKLKELLYKKPFGLSIAGSEKNVLGFDRDFLLKKHDEMYSPGNSILCVVGNNSTDEIVELAEKFCGSRIRVKVKLEKPETQVKDFSEKRPGIEQANMAIGIHVPFSEKERYAVDVFNAILGEGMSSKLFSEVREKRGLVYAVKSDVDSGKEFGYLMIYLGCDKKNLEQAKQVCIEEFKKMGEITQQELDDAKEQLIGNFRIGAEASEESANELVAEEVNFSAEKYYEYEKNVRAVGLEEVRKISKLDGFASAVLSP
jgi:predicted Zn-dependent peptidase